MNHPPKKQALLEAAIELFAKDGFWQTTTVSIAQEAVSPQERFLHIFQPKMT